ncbi:TetR/AcrR family transcriptional regulator [Streptomyces sp. ISL-86]|uniref:TetR/AcrR family transcriptional regulator n=1 Tax=Streptomyces sp. ISL-86 TaxID=2819187 RepID=UPI001BE6A78D|nr:TetR/AcrR family transcriptional regulator [Streptomyces sp. ISL-86]MBT2459215.1 TetR/AcrR family transcriptional regulator [Streptomyces sp. ISL-86]
MTRASFTKPDLSNPRVRRTRTRVLSVARELLAEVGPTALTYSLLAERGEVTRQTLYRHWPTREALLVDVMLESGDAATYPKPGSDAPEVLTAYLKSLRHGLSDEATGSALMALAAQADRDTEAAQALTRISEDRHQALNELLAPSGVRMTAEEFTLLIGPVMFRRFLDRQPVTDGYIDTVVSHWLATATTRDAPCG